MKKEEALKILERHNTWRRDNTFHPGEEMINPKILGQAIDEILRSNKSENFKVKALRKNSIIDDGQHFKISVPKTCKDIDGFIKSDLRDKGLLFREIKILEIEI